jgi:TRAP-type C4-dicarboxylate transport system substrate-binding protein
MRKKFLQKCVILSLITHSTIVTASENRETKLRILSSVPKAKSSQSYNKMIENQIDEMLQGEIDLTLFDKRRDGISLYAKLSKRSEIGFRYNY